MSIFYNGKDSQEVIYDNAHINAVYLDDLIVWDTSYRIAYGNLLSPNIFINYSKQNANSNQIDVIDSLSILITNDYNYFSNASNRRETNGSKRAISCEGINNGTWEYSYKHHNLLMYSNANNVKSIIFNNIYWPSSIYKDSSNSNLLCTTSNMHINLDAFPVGKYVCFDGQYNIYGTPTVLSNTTSMEKSYRDCVGLTCSPVSGPNVIYMNYAYSGCSNLTGSPAVGINVKYATGAYEGCYNLNGESLVGDNIEYASKMYDNCKNIIGDFVIGYGMLEANYMFRNCFKMGPNIIFNNPYNLKSLDGAFYGCNNIGKLNLEIPRGKLTSMNYCFQNSSISGNVFLNISKNSNIYSSMNYGVNIKNCFSGHLTSLNIFLNDSQAPSSVNRENMVTGSIDGTITKVFTRSTFTIQQILNDSYNRGHNNIFNNKAGNDFFMEYKVNFSSSYYIPDENMYIYRVSNSDVPF